MKTYTNLLGNKYWWFYWNIDSTLMSPRWISRHDWRVHRCQVNYNVPKLYMKVFEIVHRMHPINIWFCLTMKGKGFCQTYWLEAARQENKFFLNNIGLATLAKMYRSCPLLFNIITIALKWISIRKLHTGSLYCDCTRKAILWRETNILLPIVLVVFA